MTFSLSVGLMERVLVWSRARAYSPVLGIWVSWAACFPGLPGKPRQWLDCGWHKGNVPKGLGKNVDTLRHLDTQTVSPACHEADERGSNHVRRIRTGLTRDHSLHWRPLLAAGQTEAEVSLLSVNAAMKRLLDIDHRGTAILCEARKYLKCQSPRKLDAIELLATAEYEVHRPNLRTKQTALLGEYK